MTNTNPVSGIYIAGDNGTNPVLWVNGNADTLSTTGGSASQAMIYGGNVYVAGVDRTGPGLLTPGGPTGQYVYWKNRIRDTIGGFVLLNNTAAAGIAIAGNSIYFANGTFWVNGSRTPFQDQGVNGYIRSVFTNGNDIYAVGSANNDDADHLKNGVENDLSLNGAASGMATPVFVSGSDLYLSDDTSQGAVYWKKGVETNLLSTGNANSIFVR